MTVMKIQRTTASEGETMNMAAELARRLKGGDVITLEGPLGAGKTCFVRGLAKGLGIDPAQVSSPTFLISQEYGSAKAPMNLVHIDAYRLSGPEDLESIGWDELVEAENAILAVEWPSRIQAALHEMKTIAVTLEHSSNTHRTITVTCEGEAAGRLETFDVQRR